MRKALPLLFLAMSLPSFAYEYHLQYPPGGKGLVVIGERYNVDGTVSGSITYYTQTCTGRTCGPRTYFNKSGTWDGQGDFISATDTPWHAQSPIATNGTEVIYATSGPSKTGRDTRGFGFIDTPAPHFTWQSVDQPCGGTFPSFNACYYVIPYAPFTFTLTVLSDGDLPLNVSSESIVTAPSGYYTPSGGTGTVVSDTCHAVAPGATCTVTVVYDPTTIASTGSPYGYAYTTLTITLNSNAGNMPSWMTRFTLTGVPNGGGDN